MKRLFWGLMTMGALALAMANSAEATEPLQFDRFRAYLIYEDNGKLSKNVAARRDQIVANDENGSSAQILVDIVATGSKNALYENGEFLIVWVTDPFDEHGPAKVDKGWPISYVGLTGEVVRSIIIDHDCGPVLLHARVSTDSKTGKEWYQKLNITCGD